MTTLRSSRRRPLFFCRRWALFGGLLGSLCLLGIYSATPAHSSSRANPSEGTGIVLAQTATDSLSTHELAPGFVLHFRSVPFDPAAHDVTGGYQAIDGCPVYGTDGGRPAYELKEAYVTLRGRRLDLDVSCFYQNWPFDARNVSAEALGGDAYTLHGRFSDGAGTFAATWQVSPYGTVRTRLVSGYALMQEEQAQRDCYSRLAGPLEELAMLLWEWEDDRPEGKDARVSPQSLEAALELLDAIDRTAGGPACSP